MHLESEQLITEPEGLNVMRAFKCRFCSLCRCFGGVYQVGKTVSFLKTKMFSNLPESGKTA